MSAIRKIASLYFVLVLIFSVWGCSTEGKPGTLTEAEKSIQSTPESSNSSLSQPDPAPANTLVNKTPQELNTSIVTQANAQTNTQTKAQTKAQTNIQTNDTPGQTVPPPKTEKEQPGSGFKAARVTRVVDGDTIHVTLNGRDETVRMIGVDTPETVHPEKPVEPYGPEASAFTKSRLDGKTVYLELDAQERDKYGRLLAYVWLEQPGEITDAEIRKKMFNAILLLEGYAQLLTVPPNVKYADHFVRYQREAREAGKGLWGLEPGAQNQTGAKTGARQTPVQSNSPKPNTPSSGAVQGTGGYDCPPDHPVKGNINAKGEKIYHVPGGQFYDRTKPEMCFKTPEEAEKAGFGASKR